MKSIHSAEYQILVACLRELRTAAKLTQEELAAMIGEEQFFVSRYERGHRRLDVIELRIICEALGSSLPEFMHRLESELRKLGAQ